MSARSVGSLVGRVAAVTAAASLGQAAAVFGLAGLSGVPVSFVNAALLLGATAMLGAVWGLRAHLRDRSREAVTWVAALPPIVTGLLLTPRLFGAAARPAWITLTVALLAAPIVERAWRRWIVRDAPSTAARVLRVVAPLLALSAAVLGAREPAWTLAYGVAFAAPLVAALASSAAVIVGAARTSREAASVARYLDAIAIERERITLPPAPEVADPWLVDLLARLARRADEVASVADQDARARRAIAGARELRTRFMASMSHELRSPLNSIVGFADLLEGELDGRLTDGQRESVTMIRRSAEELIRLLTDVLDLARLEAGRLPLALEWTPSVELLTEAVSRGQALVAGREVRIEAELQPGLPPVHVDRRRILQALIALFRHAAATLERSEVRMRARTAIGPPGPESQLRIELHDAVGAIPPEEVARIFEAFREITEPTGRRVGGLGMALSLARELVRLHGGEVWAEAAPEAGTILCAGLPLSHEGGSGRAARELLRSES